MFLEKHNGLFFLSIAATWHSNRTRGLPDFKRRSRFRTRTKPR